MFVSSKLSVAKFRAVNGRSRSWCKNFPYWAAPLEHKVNFSHPPFETARQVFCHCFTCFVMNDEQVTMSVFKVDLFTLNSPYDIFGECHLIYIL
jgi:hypothetical protein